MKVLFFTILYLLIISTTGYSKIYYLKNCYMTKNTSGSLNLEKKMNDNFKEYSYELDTIK